MLTMSAAYESIQRLSQERASTAVGDGLSVEATGDAEWVVMEDSRDVGKSGRRRGVHKPKLPS